MYMASIILEDCTRALILQSAFTDLSVPCMVGVRPISFIALGQTTKAEDKLWTLRTKYGMTEDSED